MRSSSVEQLESLLQSRKLDATLLSRAYQPVRAMRTAGVAALDAQLGGGWPCGEVSEIVGRRSTGRTSVLMATMAAATRQGGVVGLIDTFDRFDPLTAARVGLDLDRVLWVRGPSLTAGAGKPRGSTYGLEAVQRAVRALDLMLRAGGFAVVAIDLADVPANGLRALPFTTWLRLAHANEGRETVCLLLGDVSVGRSARGCSVRLEAQPCWSGDGAQSRRLEGFAPAFFVNGHVLLSRDRSS